jgi:murein DD-endopeptidase MepM/ murein hydrolase activator NlpD
VLGLLAGLALVAASVMAIDRPAKAADSLAWSPPMEPLVVVRGFDSPAGPYAPGHRGVDLGGTADQLVRAAADGVVSFAGQVGGIGVVSIVHGPIRTTYQPLWGTTVKIGMSVSGGEAVGRLASVGGHCLGPCLHWGALLGLEYIDPLELLDAPPSRLLPYWHSELRARPIGGGTTGSVTAGQDHDATSKTDLRHPPRTQGGAPASLLTGSGAMTAPVENRRSVPPGLAAAIAVVGGVIGGGAFVAIRRRHR